MTIYLYDFCILKELKVSDKLKIIPQMEKCGIKKI